MGTPTKNGGWFDSLATANGSNARRPTEHRDGPALGPT